jgi:hypothetical protein
MKNLVILTFIGLTIAGVSNANQISWGSTTGTIGDHNGTPLPNIFAGDGTTPLVQLIYCGANGEIDIADQNGDGATGDDVVLGYAWIGKNWFSAGQFQGDTINNTSYADGSQLYIRAWEAPAASSGSGAVPTGNTYYGNSQKFTISGFLSGNPESFNNTTNFNTTIAIPEPAAATLIALASGAMLACKRFFGRA